MNKRIIIGEPIRIVSFQNITIIQEQSEENYFFEIDKEKEQVRIYKLSERVTVYISDNTNNQPYSYSGFTADE